MSQTRLVELPRLNIEPSTARQGDFDSVIRILRIRIPENRFHNS